MEQSGNRPDERVAAPTQLMKIGFMASSPVSRATPIYGSTLLKTENSLFTILVIPEQGLVENVLPYWFTVNEYPILPFRV